MQRGRGVFGGAVGGVVGDDDRERASEVDAALVA